MGSNEKKSRAKECGKQECGWVTAAAGRQCNRCPAGVVHRMLSSVGGRGSTHLGGQRVNSVATAGAEMSEPSAELSVSALRSYHPNVANCLCYRKDCVIQILTQREDKGSQKVCCHVRKNIPVKAEGVAMAVGGGNRWSQWRGVRGDGKQREAIKWMVTCARGPGGTRCAEGGQIIAR